VNALAWFALGAAAVFAGIDWWAVGRGDVHLEHRAKPLVLLSVIAVAVTLTPADPALRWPVVAGLVFGLVGDIGLMLDRFVAGALAFAAGHVCYLIAFVPVPHTPRALVAASLVGALLLALAAPGVVRGAWARAPTLGGVVAGYVLLLVAVLVAGAGTGVAVLAAGVVLFTVSDLLNGRRRFVGPTRGGRVAIHATYHVGQALIALSLLTLTGS